MTAYMYVEEHRTVAVDYDPITFWLLNEDHAMKFRYHSQHSVSDSVCEVILTLLPGGKVQCESRCLAGAWQCTEPHGYWQRHGDTGLDLCWDLSGRVCRYAPARRFMLLKNTAVYQELPEPDGTGAGSEAFLFAFVKHSQQGHQQ